MVIEIWYCEKCNEATDMYMESIMNSTTSCPNCNSNTYHIKVVKLDDYKKDLKELKDSMDNIIMEMTCCDDCYIRTKKKVDKEFKKVGL